MLIVRLAGVLVRCALVALCLALIVLLVVAFGQGAVGLLEQRNEEPYLVIVPDAVDPANEGRRVQLAAPAYTDEYLELRALGLRCQALRVEMNVYTPDREKEYPGLPLRQTVDVASHVRMGAFRLKLSANALGSGVPFVKIPFSSLNLPEVWLDACRDTSEDERELQLELSGGPEICCRMIENGRQLVVRGVQRGDTIEQVRAIYDDALFFHHIDKVAADEAWKSAALAFLVSWMIPALVLGVFRLVRWRKAGAHAGLAVLTMLALDAAAFLCCGGWVYGVWGCAAAGILVVCCWYIVRVIRRFGVDAET